MVVKMNSAAQNDQVKYSFLRKGGKSIIERCPVFTPNGEFLAVIVENTVRFYNKQTGDCVRTLETETYSRELVAIEFPASENYNLYGCSEDGGVTVWTWENGAVLREVSLNLEIGQLHGAKVLSFNVLNSSECLVALSYPQKKTVVLSSFSLRNGELVNEFAGTRPIYYDMIKVAIGTFNGHKFAALSNGTKLLFVQDLTRPHISEQILNINNLRIIAVAAHSNGAIAITDALGRVTVLRGNFFNKQQKISRELLHWHFLPPMAITFSLEGNYVYTGGLEKVLLKWTLGNAAHKANEKIMMPRLPGIVRFIAASNTHVAVTMSNNSIIIADTQLYLSCTVLECGGLSPVGRARRPAPLHCGRRGCLVLPARTGHLLFYSTNTDKVLFNLDITQMNDLPAERDNLIPLDTEVTCAAMDAESNWLVTSEYRNDGINYPEERLKFWAKDKGQTPYTLNTCVNLSHGGCHVVSISLNNKGTFCVTAGGDQKVRIWKQEDASLTNQKRIIWTCVTACYYSSGNGLFMSHDILNRVKNHDIKPRAERYPYMVNPQENDVIHKLVNIHKEHNLVDESILNMGLTIDEELQMGDVAISTDGSLIAAWFGCRLTLWDSNLCTLRTVLANPIMRPKGMHVLFGNKDASHYLVCTCENALVVWSLLSLTIKWYVRLRPVALAADKKTNKMAVVTDTNDVIVFSPHSSKPILTLNCLLEPETGVFKQLVFNSSQASDMIIYLMRNDSEIYSIEPTETSSGRLEAMSWGSQPASLFAAMLADQHSSDVKLAAPRDSTLPVSAHTAITQITSEAPYMVPPVSLLCTSFLQQISGQKLEDDDDDDEQENRPIEVEESSDEETPIAVEPRVSPRVNELWTPNYEAVKQKKLNKINREPFIDLQATGTLFGV